jgi:hypothetical protein
MGSLAFPMNQSLTDKEVKKTAPLEVPSTKDSLTYESA